MFRIIDLQMQQCRWPVGQDEDGLMFCGCATPEGLSYCPPHGRRSLASGKDPRPRAPVGEPRTARPSKGYADNRWYIWRADREDREPDLVALLALSEKVFAAGSER